MKALAQLSLLSLAIALFSPASLSAAEDAEALIKQGDVLDRKLQPAGALEFYLPAEKLSPDNVPLLLRIARQYRHLAGEKVSVAEKLRLSQTGLGYAKRAVELAPNNAEANLSVAISYAKMTSLLDSKEKLEATRKIKVAVDKAIALDSHQDLAWHVLGVWHQRLAEIGTVKRAAARVLYGEIPEGSSEQAQICLQKAIKLNPQRLSHYIELGAVFAYIGKPDEARKNLEKGLSMPNTDAGDPDSKDRGREILSSLK
ncbi:MAG: tetratricopeptide repeat protein [Terrimicrobiaceae bacterium]